MFTDVDRFLVCHSKNLIGEFPDDLLAVSDEYSRNVSGLLPVPPDPFRDFVEVELSQTLRQLEEDLSLPVVA